MQVEYADVITNLSSVTFDSYIQLNSVHITQNVTRSPEDYFNASLE